MIFTPRELVETAHDILAQSQTNSIELSDFEAMQLAVQLKKVDVIAASFGVHRDGNISHPAFLEKIAMELGAANNGDTIKSALYEIAESVSK